jgi:NAD+ diphosphatase
MLLGVDSSGAAWFAARMPITGAAAGLREVGAGLSGDEVSVATTAIALDNWHRTHPRCAQCGKPTVPTQAGWTRRCDADGSEHYPRTDPAVIVLVIDGEDRALLGRQGRWQPQWFSTLAGFVESGESAESAVRREIEEEAGVRVDDMVYLGSQPWPFPCSLMLGYHAWTSDVDIVVDGEEIVEARWFSRAELAAACASGEVALPPAVSIARRLIERWFGEELPGDWIRP